MKTNRTFKSQLAAALLLAAINSQLFTARAKAANAARRARADDENVAKSKRARPFPPRRSPSKRRGRII